jgi:hypothetical protein|nr:MAG TPA: hypothetical protein [Caudoviricetes sp.]
MTFKDVTRWVVIGASILGASMTLWKITKLNKENPCHDAYREILIQRTVIYILAIPLFLSRISIYFVW